MLRVSADGAMRRGLQQGAEDGLAMSSCKIHTIDFIMVEGDATLLSIEDDIREQLKLVGFDVTPRYLSKDDFNAAHQSGDFHLSFSETWGAPYDPHAYASGWMTADEGHFQAMAALEPPVSRELVFDKIQDVMQEENHNQREVKWKEIHNMVHQQAIMLPLWGKRIPTVVNRRLTGYVPGYQQFDYPVHRLQLLSGSTTVTIAPGAQTGLFQSVGRLDPHTYRPNEFFANNWVYEGLVSYGPQGQILPSLAKSWVMEARSSGGEKYTFSLRPNVTFHDGTAWNCAAAKLNFDHVLAEPLKSADYHGWYGLPEQVVDWRCESSTEFVVETKSAYYPFLQELSLIRPLRMLSPAAFVSTDPLAGNSCHVGWGNVTSEDGVSVVCAGVRNISGTGPFMFHDRTSSSNGEVDDNVVFFSNNKHWEGPPAIKRLEIVRYEDSEAIKNALASGALDIVWGAGVVTAQDLSELEEDITLSTFHTGVIQNVLLLLNSGKPPLDDISIRKTIIHAIDKSEIITRELGELERTVDNVFPLDAPYCDVDLTPRWDYDFEKAVFLNCDSSATSSSADTGSNSSSGLALGLGLGLGLLAITLLAAMIFFYKRSLTYRKEIEKLTANSTAVSA